MASPFVKNNIIYISWYDRFKGRSLNKSFRMKATKENIRKAEKFADDFQKTLDARNEELKKMKIKVDSIEYAFNHFLDLNRNKHSFTKYEYKRFFKIFSESFDPLQQCLVIDKEKSERWLLDIQDLEFAQNTIAGLAKVFKKFLKFLKEYNYIPHFVVNSDTIPRPETKPIITLTKEHSISLIDNLKNKNSNFQTAISLLFWTGLRPSDILTITVEDIDLNSSTMKYYSPKTDEYFSVPIKTELHSILKSRIDEIKKGKILDYENIGNLGKAFRRYLKQIKLDTFKYDLRTFRKSFVSTAARNGLEVALVSQLVGHKNLSTTTKYYLSIVPEQQKEQIEKFNPFK